MVKKYLALTCAALLSAVSANTYWRDSKFESFVAQMKAEQALARNPIVGSDPDEVPARENQDEQLYVNRVQRLMSRGHF